MKKALSLFSALLLSACVSAPTTTPQANPIAPIQMKAACQPQMLAMTGTVSGAISQGEIFAAHYAASANTRSLECATSYRWTRKIGPRTCS